MQNILTSTGRAELLRRRRKQAASEEQWRAYNAFQEEAGYEVLLRPWTEDATSKDPLVEAFLRAAEEKGDLSYVEGPQKPASLENYPEAAHPATRTGTYLWAQIQENDLAAAARAWAEIHLDPEEMLTKDALVDRAWLLIPQFCAERYTLKEEQVPQSMIILEGPSVTGPDEIVQSLLYVVRSGFDQVCEERGTQMIDYDDF